LFSFLIYKMLIVLFSAIEDEYEAALQRRTLDSDWLEHEPRYSLMIYYYFSSSIICTCWCYPFHCRRRKWGCLARRTPGWSPFWLEHELMYSKIIYSFFSPWSFANAEGVIAL
jgi:GAF domain-containing protein